MFIQFFVWGSWYVTAPNFLDPIGFDGTQIGMFYSTGPIAAILAPLFVGMLADRFFPVQIVLGALHILGAAIMLLAIFLMSVQEPNPVAIICVLLLYMLTYYPTLALANTLCMRNMTDSGRQFPLVRVLGTIGWIASVFMVVRAGWGANLGMFWLTAGSALFLGIYCLSLPNTPPSLLKEEEKTIGRLLGMDALVLFKDRSYLAFIVASVLICIPLAFYYQLIGRFLDMGRMEADLTTLGQATEILFMLVLPFLFVRLGVKWMLAVGMLAWTLRYVLFALGAPDAVAWMVIGGILLHGICYDFFFVTGQIYTDKVAPKAIRGQAQGMVALFTLGLGMFIGFQLCGMVEKHFTPQVSVDAGEAYKERSEELKHIEGVIALAYGESGPESWDEYSEILENIDSQAGKRIEARDLDGLEQDLLQSELELDAEGMAEYLEPHLDKGVDGLQELLDDEDRGWVGDHQGTRNYLEGRAQRLQDGTAETYDREYLLGLLQDWTEIKGLWREDLLGRNWQGIWTVPAIMSGVVMALFLVFFRQPQEREAGGQSDSSSQANADEPEHH